MNPIGNTQVTKLKAESIWNKQDFNDLIVNFQ